MKSIFLNLAQLISAMSVVASDVRTQFLRTSQAVIAIFLASDGCQARWQATKVALWRGANHPEAAKWTRS